MKLTTLDTLCWDKLYDRYEAVGGCTFLQVEDIFFNPEDFFENVDVPLKADISTTGASVMTLVWRLVTLADNVDLKTPYDWGNHHRYFKE